MGFLRFVADVICACDYITPIASLATGSREDRFAVDENDYVEAERLLKRAGIRTHWPGLTGRQYVFDVDKGRGDDALRILRRAGML